MGITRLLVLLLIIGATTLGVCRAESYMGIRALDTLGDVRARFPAASIVKLNPAWAQPNDALCEMTGSGLSGKVLVKFDDMRPSYKNMADANPERKDYWLAKAAKGEDESLLISWVRWVPMNNIPLQNLIAKYGAPDKEGFHDDDFSPYRMWQKRRVTAYLTADQKMVTKMDFAHTEEELNAELEAKFGVKPSMNVPKTTRK